MSEVKTSAVPAISYLDPRTVKQGWEGIVKIHGDGFDVGSFSLFDGAVPRVAYKSDHLLEADIKVDITGTLGTKQVKVHTSAGGVSNQVDFLVSPKSDEPDTIPGPARP